ncbi:hypothetical protein QUF90_11360 [Desulfococcaceae bacterium HSG9]|nr:hypothetical protein [Desulfococcaceae bacterium HSG9]
MDTYGDEDYDKELSDFQYVVSGEAVMANGQTCFFISEQIEFQKDILSPLGVTHRYFTYGYLFDTG